MINLSIFVQGKYKQSFPQRSDSAPVPTSAAYRTVMFSNYVDLTFDKDIDDLTIDSNDFVILANDYSWTIDDAVLTASNVITFTIISPVESLGDQVTYTAGGLAGTNGLAVSSFIQGIT